MCQICGCDSHDPHAHDHVHPHRHGPSRLAIEAGLLVKSDRLAHTLRQRFERDDVTVINLIGAPGAGKTALLERTLPSLEELPAAVIEGDQATDRDAQRITATGRRVVQVNTDAGCHLDPGMIGRALPRLAMVRGTLLFVENVGNLVCPALFDLGEHAKVVVVSITEGVDKPLKYPHIYRAARAMVVTKLDLAPHVDVDPGQLVEHARRINPELAVFPVSNTEGRGLAEWTRWLRDQVGARRG